MDDLLRSGEAPVGLLHQATRVWRSSLPSHATTHHYGVSYLAPTPTTWAQQQMGLDIVKALSRMCLTGMKMASDHSYKPGNINRRRRNATPAGPARWPPPAINSPPNP